MTEGSDPRLVVLLSGRGSNFRALHKAQEKGWLGGRIVAVISDRAGSQGLERARALGLDTVCLERARHDNRESFETSLSSAIDGFDPALIVLAGFMRVLSAAFVSRYPARMINIHPSLLPRHRGLNTHQRVLDAGEREHGASVHFVTPQLDGGPVISQVRMAVASQDTAEILADRLLPLEHRLLPATVALLLHSLVEVRNETISIDNKKVARPLLLGRDLDDHGHRI
jgi:phosphoribosylglycinamide formyltransferase 1